MRRAEPGGKRGLTTADAKVKCDIEEGLIGDEDLWYGMAIKSGTRNDAGGSLGEEKVIKGRVTYSDQRSDSAEAAITKGFVIISERDALLKEYKDWINT